MRITDKHDQWMRNAEYRHSFEAMEEEFNPAIVLVRDGAAATITISDRSIFVPGDGSIGTRAKILDAFDCALGEGQQLLGFNLPGKLRYEIQLRLRVQRHVRHELDDMQRAMNKKSSRRHSHWCHALGRFVDDGE